MSTLTLGRVLRTREPTLLVENDLAPGRHRFQLTVVDDGGLESEPTELVVAVLARRGPSLPVPPGRIPIGRVDPVVATPVRPSPPPQPVIGPVIRPIRPIR